MDLSLNLTLTNLVLYGLIWNDGGICVLFGIKRCAEKNQFCKAHNYEPFLDCASTDVGGGDCEIMGI